MGSEGLVKGFHLKEQETSHLYVKDQINHRASS